MKKPDDPVGMKLFQLAELALDDALEDNAPPQMRLETLKCVTQLYVGHTRATKNAPPADDGTMTFDKLRERINSVEEVEE
jgi:hypothetical protein